MISGFLSLSAFGANILFTIRVYQFDDIIAAEVELKQHGIAALFLSASVEIIISSTLIYYLYTRRTGLHR
ncbi:hypothetical protein GY45DRAFT_1374258 [Cubamyces sp. BRFM 1775]|nr:hypothetical protein GY45DRAFT_1374258 [Cubamyces sp. BRFM 1775]